MNFYEILWERAQAIQRAEFMAGNEKGFRLCVTNILIYEALLTNKSITEITLI